MEPKHLAPYSRISPALSQTELASKAVLITGGGYGIGAAIAEAFVEAGVAHIILVGRTVSRLKATADKLSSIKSANTDISYVAVDVESKTDVRQFFESLTVSPDILINNAGYLAAPANFIDADLEDYWKSFSTNVYGTVLVTQSFLQHRRSHATSSDPAVIITLNTIGAYTVRIPLLSSYGASKAALARWSESVSVDVPESVARFISLHPGGGNRYGHKD
jgi:NAD(P)-dependent dehydrogenase (short-subunit alcohol dehydrogenase family)